jgi:RNA 3'-terminal phosphate cyclase (ATP)
MITLDGSKGEGGGQILRTALSLSMVTGRPFRMHAIRAGRKKPGLLRQHLAAVNAAREITAAEVGGAVLGSGELSFSPGSARSGDYRFAVGSAGSATLVFQTVLPALMLADGVSRLTLEGGTHNPFAPPFDFLGKTFLPALARMGPTVALELERPGFFPAGGGLFRAIVEPVKTLAPLELNDRGLILGKRARALVSQIPEDVARRELRLLRHKLDLDEEACSVEVVRDSPGPGNAVMIELESESVTEVFSAFGERGLKAEWVAREAVKEARRYLKNGAPVGEHLADQLALPLALAGQESFTTGPLSRHATTNLETIGAFLPVDFAVVELDDVLRKVSLGASG